MVFYDMRLSQVVSDSNIDPENLDPAGTCQIVTNLDVQTTLGKLEAQLQKQELLNSHFASQITVNSNQIQTSIQEFQTSLQLIFQELKDLKQTQASKNTDEIPTETNQQVPVIRDPQIPSSQALNSSTGIFGSASKNGIASASPCLDETDFKSAFMIVKMDEECKMFVDMTDKVSNLIVSNLRDLEYREIFVDETDVGVSNNVLIFSKLSEDDLDMKIVNWIDKVLDEMHYRYLMVGSLLLDFCITSSFVFDPGGDTFNVEFLVKHLLRQLAGNQEILVNVYNITNCSMPLVMYEPENPEGYTSLSHNSTLDFGDPYRKHKMQCRYSVKHSMSLAIITIPSGVFVICMLVGYMMYAAWNRYDNVKEDCRKMEELKVKAESADVAKSQFLMTISHEIRTPMNGVLSMLDMLLDTDMNLTQKEYAQTAQICGKALTSLLNEVIDRAKIDARKLELEAVPFVLQSILDDVLAVFVLDRVPEVLTSDRRKFQQIIIHFVGKLG